MPNSSLVDSIIQFGMKVNVLKQLERKSYAGDGSRRESVAEHISHMGFLAQLLSPFLATPVDLEKVFKLILVHDLPEIVAGDTFAYDFNKKTGQHDRENKALVELLHSLPGTLAESLHELWNEFIALESREALFVQAIDRLQGFLQQVTTEGRVWREEVVRREWTVERTKPVALFDPFLADVLDSLYRKADEDNMWAVAPADPSRRSGPFDAVVVGGGPAGLMTAYRLLDERPQLSVAIVDEQLADGKPAGGLAVIAGTKLSLPPAGMGLLPVAGSEENFRRVVLSVLSAFRAVDSVPGEWHNEQLGSDEELTTELRIRKYDCVMLDPDQMMRAVGSILQFLRDKHTTFVPAQCSAIRPAGEKWAVSILLNGREETLTSDSVFFAAGRSAAAAVMPPDLPRRSLKGIDVGMRFAFDDIASFVGLSRLGEDAKVLWKRCRVFCVNAPGRIERYGFRRFTIPGGIYHSGEAPYGNFGILCRVGGKSEVILRVERVVEEKGLSWIERPLNSFDQVEEMGVALYGEDVATELVAFSREIERAGLADFGLGWSAHFPLMDWHWDTYCEWNTVRTAAKFLYVVGDAAGHARGILQAAMSGWLGADSFFQDLDNVKSLAYAENLYR